jgi:hypothetical protein
LINRDRLTPYAATACFAGGARPEGSCEIVVLSGWKNPTMSVHGRHSAETGSTFLIAAVGRRRGRLLEHVPAARFHASVALVVELIEAVLEVVGLGLKAARETALFVTLRDVFG